jgi:signal transduction histidine kinase
MHDVLAHSLSALALQLESTRLLAIKHGIDGAVTGAIDRAHRLAATGLREARSAIATARGDEVPGPDGIGALADAFAQESGLPVEVAVRGRPRALPPDARVAVFRTVQEALTNIRRHATPERVSMRLEHEPEGTRLVVEDIGRPAMPVAVGAAAAPGSGYGLTGMRERAELLGGRLAAEPTSTGFRVELWLPA